MPTSASARLTTASRPTVVRGNVASSVSARHPFPTRSTSPPCASTTSSGATRLTSSWSTISAIGGPPAGDAGNGSGTAIRRAIA